jgi:hypothetical protein
VTRSATFAATEESSETLANRLSQGPLPLRHALQYATDVANRLRQLHDGNQPHGSVDARYIAVTSTGAQLLPPAEVSSQTGPTDDVSAFGVLLHELLTGSKLFPQVTPPPPPDALRNTKAGIKIAAIRLASKCVHSDDGNSNLEMQHVLTELRLLNLQARVRERPFAVTAERESDSLEVLPEFPVQTQPVAQTTGPAELAEPTEVVSPQFTSVPADSFMAHKGDAAEPLPTGVKCPLCGALYVYPSRTRTWFENVLASWGCAPQRCHRCLHRYVVILNVLTFAKGSPMKSNQS